MGQPKEQGDSQNDASGRRSNEALLESEERLSFATAAAGIGVWTWDIAQNDVWATVAWCRMFGFLPDATISYEAVIERIHPEDRKAVDNGVRRAIKEGADYAGEFRVVLPDGAQRWIAARGQLDSNPRVSCRRMRGASVDITDRKRVESELEERLRFEKLLADLSATFVHLSSDKTYDRIAESMKILVEVLGHDRSTLAEFDDDVARIIHSHTVTGKKPFGLKEMPYDLLPWYFRQLREAHLVFFERPDELPLEAAIERQFCAAEGIQSHISIPLMAAGSVLGALNFSSFRHVGYWEKDVLSRIQLIGEVFANAILHKRDQEAIDMALAESERLREQLERENIYLREQITLKHDHGRMVGESRALSKALAEAEQVAMTDTPVLLLGETGTGKELFAQEIHALSKRKKQSMVVINCASLPSTLIESELFGREAGAYTGAASAQLGRFEIADGATLFLDEIGELPIELQAKLLRVLEDGQFQRLGSPETVTVDVRIIAATNRDLEKATRGGDFRADLYHRLSVFPIRIPPLRERREDIPVLIWTFVEDFGRRMGKKISSIPRRVMDQLQQHPWPGNVRELRNVIERGMILTSGETLHIELPSDMQASSTHRQTLKECEHDLILRVLKDTAWRIRGPGGASEILGIKPTTLEARWMLERAVTTDHGEWRGLMNDTGVLANRTPGRQTSRASKRHAGSEGADGSVERMS